MNRRPNAGFSLLELVIAMVLLLVISAVIFQVINMSTERSATEQVKLDMFQEAREFMDQMTRELRLAGYPNRRNFALNVLISPLINDLRAAVGLVKVGSGELWFEGDVDGTGTVSVVHYYLDTSNTNNCPCLKRSSLPKINGDPLTGQTTPSYQLEVQGVTNTNIFSAYSDATSLSLPLDIGSNASSIASIDTVMATL